MSWTTEVREVHDHGVPMGRYRLVGIEDCGRVRRVVAFCQHSHRTREEAASCEACLDHLRQRGLPGERAEAMMREIERFSG